jgi:hypothetical protein
VPHFLGLFPYSPPSPFGFLTPGPLTLPREFLLLPLSKLKLRAIAEATASALRSWWSL